MCVRIEEAGLAKSWTIHASKLIYVLMKYSTAANAIVYRRNSSLED
jgi:hypothetical protein